MFAIPLESTFLYFLARAPSPWEWVRQSPAHIIIIARFMIPPSDLFFSLARVPSAQEMFPESSPGVKDGSEIGDLAMSRGRLTESLTGQTVGL
jgi:hypothetical protein